MTKEYQVQKMPALLRSPLVTFLGAPFHVLQRMDVLAMGRKTNIKPKVKSETVKASSCPLSTAMGHRRWRCGSMKDGDCHRLLIINESMSTILCVFNFLSATMSLFAQRELSTPPRTSKNRLLPGQPVSEGLRLVPDQMLTLLAYCPPTTEYQQVQAKNR